MRSIATSRQSAIAGWVVAVLLAAGIAGATPSRALAGVVTFSPLNGSFTCSDTITVDATVDAAVTDLRGFSFVFQFNPAIVTPVSVQPGSLVTGAGCPNSFFWLNQFAIGDSIAVDGATLGCSVNGPGAFVRMRFVGTGNGISPIACRSGILRDSNNANIPFTCVAGTIAHDCPSPVEATAWGRVKALYR